LVKEKGGVEQTVTDYGQSYWRINSGWRISICRFLTSQFAILTCQVTLKYAIESLRRRQKGNEGGGMMRQPLVLTLPLCSICRYKHKDSLTYRKSFPTCDAFPNGIPEAVRKNKMDHRKAIAGDNGIRFELAVDTEPMKQLLSSFDLLFQKQNRGNRIVKAE
jgi:hypothetical protein